MNPAAESTEIWLFNLPPTRRQTRIAVAVAMALLAGLGGSAVFADTPLPRIDAFIPSLEGAVILTDLITSVLLFSQCWASHSRALLALASGYLFTALIVIPHVLTFPGAFSPTGLLGAGLQTTGWLYVFWHFGLPASLIIYAWLKDEKLKDPVTKNIHGIRDSLERRDRSQCGLRPHIACYAGERILAPLFLDATHIAPLAHYILAFNILVCTTALVILWRQRHSVLDQWLMVAGFGARFPNS